MINGLLDNLISRSRTVLLILILIFISGSIAYMTIPKEAQPDITIPLAYVSMHHEGISPEDAERMLVRPMENELRGLDGLKEITATAYEGGANLILEFEAGLDIDPIIADVREEVDIAKADLPEETDEPIVSEINLALQPVILVSLTGNIPERQLLSLARDLRDELEGISQVLEVEIAGDREELLELIINPTLLDTYELNLNDILNSVRANNVLVAAGNLDSGAGRIPVKVPGLFESAEDLLNLPLKVVGDRVIRVREIATVRPTFKDPMSYSRVNGVSSLTLNVKKRVGENVIATVDQVREVVAAEQKRWPDSVQVSFTADQSDDIRMMLTDLQNNVISAVVLVMIVCIAALGLRGGLLVGVAIPGSFLAGMLILSSLGLTVNIVVLFSLILAVGMLVDGAIVVTELADRKMSEGLPPPKAYLIASQRMAMPIIASTATTLAAFMPLLFWPGIVGEFMKFLPITLIATLSASLLMALVFVPTIGSVFGKPGPANEATMKSLAAAEGGDLTQIGGATGWYIRRVQTAIRHPWIVLGIAVFLFIFAQVLYSTLGKGIQFFPKVDPEFASIIVRMRGNLSIEEIDAKVRAVEERVRQVDGLASVNVRSAISLSGDGITEDTHGLIQVEMEDWQLRQSGQAILDEIALRTVGLPGLRLEAIPTEGEDDLRLAVSTAFALSATQIADKLEGLHDRLALVGDYARIDVEDGSAVESKAGEVLIGRLELIARPSIPEIELPEGFEDLGFFARLFAPKPPEPYTAPPWSNYRDAVQERLSELRAAEEDLGLRFELKEPAQGPPTIDVFISERGTLAADFERVSGYAEALKTVEVASVDDPEKDVEPLGAVRTYMGAQIRDLEQGPVKIAEVGLSYSEATPASARGSAALLAELEPLLQGVPGVIVEQNAIEAGPPTGKDVQIELTSFNPEVLLKTVDRVREQLEGTQGLLDVDDSRPVPGVEWQVSVDRAAAGRYGANISLVGNYIQFVTGGVMLGTYRPDRSDDEVDIRARFPAQDRFLTQIEELRVVSSAGLVPIAHFVDRYPKDKTGNIERIDGRRVYRVTANVDEANYLVSEKVNELKAWAEAAEWPPGVSYEFRGQDEEQQESMVFLMKAFGVALFVMAIILVTQFNNFYYAFLVLTAVIFSTVGVFIGLLITDYPFSVVMNGIGVIALAGIVVNNNIVLIDTFQLHKANGMAVREAVLRTCAQRLRPVVLTTVTTSLGLLPMVLKMNIDFVNTDIAFNAPSTQWWVQLATSVSFGLLFATLLTLVLTPSLLMLGHNVAEGTHAMLERMRGHSDQRSQDQDSMPEAQGTGTATSSA